MITDERATLKGLRAFLETLNTDQNRDNLRRSELYAEVGRLDNITSDRLRMIQHYRESIKLLEKRIGDSDV